MYIGSVRFFKHLILSVVALLIIVPTTCCVYFAFQYNSVKAQLNELIASAEEQNGTDLQDEEHRESPFTSVYASEEIPSEPVYAFPYQLMYPDLYVENDFQYINVTENTVYLTFDDGPTTLTPQVLDILRDNDVRATFFVVYKSGDDAAALYRRIVDEGHTLAVHSASHDYRIIYQSVDAFLDDFSLLSNMLEEVTGVKPEIFRFPGGSINSYNRMIYQELIAEMLRRGYTYYDWNVSSGSSTNTATRDSIYSNVMRGISNKQKAIVLMHDAGTSATVAALPGIISSLKASGYNFDVLTKEIMPTNFDYSN